MRVLTIALSALTAAFLVLAAAMNLFALPDPAPAAADDPAVLELSAAAFVLWAATAAANAAVLVNALGRRRAIDVLNLSSLALIVLLAALLIYAGTAWEIENAILAIPTAIIMLGYWQIVQHARAG
jgi:hypothetical protein